VWVSRTVQDVIGEFQPELLDHEAAATFADALRWRAEVYHALKAVIKREENEPGRQGQAGTGQPASSMLEGCRSGSQPWRWPLSCGGGRPERGSQTRWRTSIMMEDIAVSCSGWSPGPRAEP